MENIKKLNDNYFELLEERGKQSKVYKSYQATGLMLAEILNDNSHKALYIKLSKIHNSQFLIGLARKIAEKKDIRNRGAYFMKVLKEEKNK
ncbi:MAG: hypothetical protein PHP03_00900 [Candidatus Pacebacteria bacterium]|nr:hypothetical protein [Candidatus Paceibacterota bacterium]